MPVPQWRTPSKKAVRRAERRPLHRELIVDTALRIVDSVGLDGLSMRRVAAELDTGPASLYAHVNNKDELIELLVDRIIGEIPLPGPADPDRWQEQLKQFLRDQKRVLEAHRDIVRGLLGTIPTGYNGLIGGETMLTLLRTGGLPDQITAFGVDLLSLYVQAHAYESSLRLASPEGEPEEQYRQIGEFFAALPAERFPTMVSMAATLMQGTDVDRFEFGLDLLIRGLAAHAEPQ